MAVVINAKGTSVSQFQIGKQGPLVKNVSGNVNFKDSTDSSFIGISVGSVVIGSPTGGDQGAGTLNATGLFINGVAVSGSGLANVIEDTTPQLGGQLDINGFAIGNGTEELLKFIETGSAVNEITITNAATGTNPQITASGNDAAIGLDIRSKGTGTINFDTASGSNRQVQILNTASAVNNLTLTGSATGDSTTIAVAGTDTNISIKIEPKGTGEVILGTITAATSSLQAEDDQSFVIKGGDSVSSAAGDLILEGGNGSGVNTDGDVIIRPGTGATTPTGQVCIQDDDSENVACFIGTSGLDVNYFKFTSAITAASPTIAVSGTDTNISIKIESKGTGQVILGPTTAATSSLQAEDDQDFIVKSGDSVAANAGDLILEGGDGTGALASGNTIIRGGTGGSAAGTVIIDSTEFALPVAGGVTVGSATGGNQGSGTINATALYINGNVLPTILSGSAALDFGSIASLGQADLTITVTGAAIGDEVALGLPSTPTSGIIFNAFVSATNTVTVRAHNYTAGAIDPANATYSVKVFQ